MNLYNKEIHQLTAIMGASRELYYATDYIPVLSNTTYTKSNNTRYELYDINKTLLKGATGSTFTTTSDTRYIRYNVLKTEIDTHQLEQGSTATSYEPYKVNEEVELRGIGDVQDTLDCLTGEVIERIGEFVLDGSEDEKWITNEANYGDNTAVFYIDKLFEQSSTLIMDKITPYIGPNFWPSVTNDNENHLNNNRDLAIRISKTRLSSIDVNGFRQWLSQNPITIQHTLISESIKTVDLTTVNEKGETTHFMPLEGTMHVQSSGEIIQPTFDMSVPVEATTQNLASFIELEME